jgi:uncharacterized membrane protein (DUF4010 family)
VHRAVPLERGRGQGPDVLLVRDVARDTDGVVSVVGEAWGRSGLLTSAAVLGLIDVDSLTMSMARGAAQTVSPAVAATAIAVGVLANTGMKLGLALSLGSAVFRTIAGGALALMFLALGLVLVWPWGQA